MTDTPCEQCRFGLWEPIAGLSSSRLGLYNDDRFPGRCILTLNEHHEELTDLPADILTGFMGDVQAASRAIKAATGAARVNMAVLGNRESHVHAHLIPRYPEMEEFPDCSPWNDLRLKGKLDANSVRGLKERVLHHLTSTQASCK